MSEPTKKPAPAFPALLPPQVAAVIARAKGLFLGLSKGARILLISTATLAAIFVGYLVFNATNEKYGTLFTQLDRDDASGVVAKLKEMKVPYKLSQDGATIEVPEAKVLDLRLELATTGLPRGGGVGFESFDKMRLGATEFEQRVLYRRALEGELSRTIGTITGVESTRVHLVMPEKSVFVSRTEPASASIVVKMKPGHTIEPQEIGGIIHLTASAVPGLTSDAVTLVTTDGQMLHRPRKQGENGSSDDDNGETSSSHALETSLSDRAREMIEKIVGAGHVDVQVSADIDTARVEHVEDHYNPMTAVIRSEEATTERSSGGFDDTVAGVPGAESNVPSGSSVNAAKAAALAAAASAAPAASSSAAPNAAAIASALAPTTSPLSLPSPAMTASVQKGLPAGTTRESHTRNFEIDHVSDKRTLAPGAVRRLAVAVVVDGIEITDQGQNKVVARDREQLDKIAALVRGAVGIDEKRGDILTVESVPFLSGHVEAPVVVDAPKPFPIQITLKDLKDHKKLVGIGAGALFAFGLLTGIVIKRRRARARAAALLAAVPEERNLTFGAAPVITPLEHSKLSPEEMRLAAHERAQLDPATAALVLKAWLGAAEGEEKIAHAQAS